MINLAATWSRLSNITRTQENRTQIRTQREYRNEIEKFSQLLLKILKTKFSKYQWISRDFFEPKERRIELRITIQHFFHS